MVIDDGNDRSLSVLMIAVGGWNSFQAIEPYLNAPSEQVVNDAFADVELGI